MTESYQDWMDAMASFVHYRMKAMGISLEDLAGNSGLPLDYVREVAGGKKFPTHKARLLLAKGLGASMEFVRPKPKGKA